MNNKILKVGDTVILAESGKESTFANVVRIEINCSTNAKQVLSATWEEVLKDGIVDLDNKVSTYGKNIKPLVDETTFVSGEIEAKDIPEPNITATGKIWCSDLSVTGKLLQHARNEYPSMTIHIDSEHVEGWLFKVKYVYFTVTGKRADILVFKHDVASWIERNNS